MEHGPIDHQGAPLEDAPVGRRRRRAARWAVPGVAVLAVGGVIAGLTAAGAQASPVLPARTAAQLLVDMAKSDGPGPMSGTVQETASLGLPALPGSDNPSSFYSLLSGSHTFNIWYADKAHVRISEPVQLGESDLRVNGRQVWLWNSKTQTATHIVRSGAGIRLPGGRDFAEPLKPGFMPHVFKKAGRICVMHAVAGQAKPVEKCVRAPRARAFFRSHPIKLKTPSGILAKQRPFAPQDKTPPTPQQAASKILAALGPTTTVSVQSNVMVAGQAAYQISLAPKDGRSLIGRIQIAIDAHKYFPLRFQVFARGQASPAFEVGFTSLTYGRPAPSNFTFTPPHGAKVRNLTAPGGPPASPFGLGAAIGWHAGWGGSGPVAGGLSGGPGGIAAPRVMGQGWLSVLVDQPPATDGTYQVYSHPGSAGTHVTYVPADGSQAYSSSVVISSDSAPAGRALSVQGPAGATGASPDSLGPLLQASTPVHGAWGSGHLVKTALVNVLITSNGTVLAGAVQPSVLYADAAAIK